MDQAVGAAGLIAVQRARRLAIAFENLDIPLGRGIRLDPDHLFDELVVRRRRGYCFEQTATLPRHRSPADDQRLRRERGVDVAGPAAYRRLNELFGLDLTAQDVDALGLF